MQKTISIASEAASQQIIDILAHSSLGEYWVSSCLRGWRQPSSSMCHKPELIANQSNKLQLIS